ncbi:MAG: aminotransferase class V-fold PLP-dependent enzyme [Pseudobdellovibrio sp.]
MYKRYYTHFLKANQGIQHYTAHSHHFWPDVTRDATVQYWDDSAKYTDEKWDYFFSHKIPVTQKLIADILQLTNPSQIAFAPNTHEFVYRLLSCFEFNKQIRILTTDSEFYSFDRQIDRLAEDKKVSVDKVVAESLIDFEERFIQKLKSNSYDMVFISQVFFNSGYALPNIEKIVKAIQDEKTMIVVDGYHGFMAVPTNLSSIEDRIFYLAGSYKYAQAGEGCCFMHVPKECRLRPSYTGWFAGGSKLLNNNEIISYADNGFRFAGATMDFSALYRLHSVLDLFKQDDLTVDKIHCHVQQMQLNFKNHLRQLNSKMLSLEKLIEVDPNHQGHFLTFRMHDLEQVKKVHDVLNKNKIKTDFRGNRLRFGFGLYQESCINLQSVVSSLELID